MDGKRIAIVGGGAAGLGAARALVRAGVGVTLFERAPRLGGNCVGLPVRGADGRTYGVDAGVSDFNRVTFTEVAAMIDELGLETRPVRQDVHFGSPEGSSLWGCHDGAWTFRQPFAGQAALVDEIAAFRGRALEVRTDPRFATCTLGAYLDHIGASRTFREAFLYPCALGSFPMPGGDPARYHARSLVRFRHVHGLVADGPADRRVVVGGMHRYVPVLQRWLEAAGVQVRCGAAVEHVRRLRRGVELEVGNARGPAARERFDGVILAGHAGVSLRLLEDATASERTALAAFRAQRARVVVHTDARLMGDDRSLWGAYNYVVHGDRGPDARPTITFWPNRLASLPAAVPDVFVSMNPHLEPDPARVLASRTFLHPLGCPENDAAAARLERLQGHGRTWYAGAHLRNPYVHESAFASGTAAARALLARLGTARIAV